MAGAAGTSVDPRAAGVISRLTLEEKVAHLRDFAFDDAARGPFPLPIALASTWDLALVREIHAARAAQLRSRGVRTAFVGLDVARDPRRGRIAETFGEDPYLVGELAVAAIEGLRGGSGSSELASDKVLVAARHLAGHGPAASGSDATAAPVSERELREVFLPPFEQAVRRTRLDAIVAARNDIDGIPSHANRALLHDVLRGEWGFGGAVLASGTGVEELRSVHGVAGNAEGAALLAFDAGIDAGSPAYASLAAAVRSGALPEARIDAAAARVLSMKVRSEVVHPGARNGVDESTLRGLARKAALRSITLLKNEGALPLAMPVEPATIAVVDFSGDASIAEALRVRGRIDLLPAQRAPAAATSVGPVVLILPDAAPDAGQRTVIDALHALGRPLVAVFAGERPGVPQDVAARSAAVVAAWGLGPEAGAALAAVLFGDANPGGKLAVTLARGPGQLPMFYDVKPSARRGYLFDSNEPLYPFGWGLGYAPFELGAPRLSAATMGTDGAVRVSVDLRNAGTRAGDETVQLYVRDRVSSVTRPVKSLRGFERVTLAPGERRTVTFTLEARSLALWDLGMRRVVEPGEFEVLTGSSSAQLQSATLTVLPGAPR